MYSFFIFTTSAFSTFRPFIGKKNGKRKQVDAADAVKAPMWAPPFPPEEFDDYDDDMEAGASVVR